MSKPVPFVVRKGQIIHMTRTNEKCRTAVVLSGGGGKGAYEVGVLKALKAQGVEPDIYCGTSVGSFNCAMLVSGKSLEEVEQVWRGLSTDSVFRLRYDPRRFISLDPRTPLRFAVESARLLGGFAAEVLKSSGRWWEKIDLDSFLIDTSPLGDLIAANVDLDAVRRSPKQLFIAMTRLKPTSVNPQEIVCNRDVTHRHVLASCSLPMIFPPVTIGNEVFCDGGVVMNSPLSPAVKAGAEEIYVVDLTPPPRGYQEGTLALAYQVLSAQFASMLQRDIEYAMHINDQYLAAHREGRLVGGRLEMKGTDRSAAGLEPHPRRYRYLRLHWIRPKTDLDGLAGFLKFDPETAADWIETGKHFTAETLHNQPTEDITAPDGSVMKAYYLC
jgi:NTE family protein